MRPTKDEYPSFFETYVSKVPDGDIVQQMRQGVENTVKLISPLNDDLLNYRYAEGKWSIKEVLMHLSDAERIFSYRALRFARRDKTDLPGFDENIYVPASKATQRTAESILNEYQTVRAASLTLFENLDDEALQERGTANGRTTSVRAMAYILVGHELHHVGIIKERYLKK